MNPGGAIGCYLGERRAGCYSSGKQKGSLAKAQVALSTARGKEKKHCSRKNKNHCQWPLGLLQCVGRILSHSRDSLWKNPLASLPPSPRNFCFWKFKFLNAIIICFHPTSQGGFVFWSSADHADHWSWTGTLPWIISLICQSESIYGKWNCIQYINNFQHSQALEDLRGIYIQCWITFFSLKLKSKSWFGFYSPDIFFSISTCTPKMVFQALWRKGAKYINTVEKNTTFSH